LSFTWHSAGHAFASLFKDVVTVTRGVTNVREKVKAHAGLIEELSGLVNPQAANVEQLAFGALGLLMQYAAEPSAGTHGLNVYFDAETVAEAKALLAKFPEIVSQVKAVFR
jgi:hypothetical protein